MVRKIKVMTISVLKILAISSISLVLKFRWILIFESKINLSRVNFLIMPNNILTEIAFAEFQWRRGY